MVSAKLGLTSFGGPVAHLGYFRNEYVERRGWLDDRSYADLVALCQFLPGPASSQVGIGIGLMRGGLPGALAAWLGFTLPSVLLMILFAYFVEAFGWGETGWVHGLQVAAVAIVAQAVLGMGRSLAPDRGRLLIVLGTAIISLLVSSAWIQVILLLVAGSIGWLFYRSAQEDAGPMLSLPLHKKSGAGWLTAFFLLLILLPLLRSYTSLEWLAVLDSFYRSGSLVFGGGHVVLPLLEQEVVPSGWVTREQFLAGYGAAQAVPGPLFTFAAYLGMVIHGWMGAVLATAAIFLPAFLLVVGTLPYWERLRRNTAMRGALAAVNAAVVGILLAALYDPVWTSSIHTGRDFALALAAFGLLVYGKLPPWIVVAVAAVGGWVLTLFPG
ncbi:chromate efflux transporter [Paenibacillus sp. J2TS4]|uniref:chromate efflux transporter n=1 Tax=Paenibacillus sp. J2TS4 TaxID=2807194 RepID=UPI001B0F7822|nr:chromate efflux transporter [Paenibacillus sp. J2TS4]GIP34767.1 chromate transporter [Paenibacillus sp. J2TS4]